jgi:3-oxoacyl-[acyl-carrier protein] reductase
MAAESRGRTALVTGASRGIGRAVAVELARRGTAVAINYRRDDAAAEDTVREIVASGGTAAAFRASIDDEAEVERMVNDVHERLGPIDTLIHNAGMASSGRDIAGTEAREVRRLLGVHALGPFHLTRLLLDDLRSAPRGDVVFVSSSGAAKNLPNTSSYNMAKAAMEALAMSLAHEELRHGLHVNIVLPGLTATDMADSLLRMVGVEDAASLRQHFPFGHICRPEEVAAVIAFVVSDAASYLTGQRIFVDGGAEVDLVSALTPPAAG